MFRASFQIDLDKVREFQNPFRIIVENNRRNDHVVDLEAWDENKYQAFSHDLRGLLLEYQKEYFLFDHFNELLYVIVVSYESLFESYFYNQSIYLTELERIETAKLLLVYREFSLYKEDCLLKGVSVDRPFGLTIKYLGKEIEITNNYLTDWVLERFYNAIENGDSPFYHTDLYTFSESNNDIKSMSTEKIRLIANSRPRKPVQKLSKRNLVFFCKELQKYLDVQTYLKTPPNKKLGNTQAKFLFQILILLGLLDDQKIDSPAEVYLHSLYSNYA